MSSAQLYGLILAGGRSRRMQHDKALLDYAGRPQLERALQLLAPCVRRCFVSIRKDQRDDPLRTRYDTIVDLKDELGPIAGIHAALNAAPDHAWLVLACDLPFLDTATLEHLIARRDPARLATAYRSSFDGQPEPLCAIFEPASRAAIDAWITQGHECPRAFLAQADALLLDPVNVQALDNVNTREQYAAARASLTFAQAVAGTDTPAGAGTCAGPGTCAGAAAPPPVARRLTVRYFALLREQAGLGNEQIETQARTPLELYRELRRRHGLGLDPISLRVAINDEFGDWATPLVEGDTVAFLPPVAGG